MLEIMWYDGRREQPIVRTFMKKWRTRYSFATLPTAHANIGWKSWRNFQTKNHKGNGEKMCQQKLSRVQTRIEMGTLYFCIPLHENNFSPHVIPCASVEVKFFAHQTRHSIRYEGVSHRKLVRVRLETVDNNRPVFVYSFDVHVQCGSERLLSLVSLVSLASLASLACLVSQVSLFSLVSQISLIEIVESPAKTRRDWRKMTKRTRNVRQDWVDYDTVLRR